MSKKFGKTRYVWSSQDIIGYLLRDSDDSTVSLEKFYEIYPGSHDLDYYVEKTWDGKTILHNFIEILEESRKIVGENPIIYVEVDSTMLGGSCVTLEEELSLTEKLGKGLCLSDPHYEDEMFQRKRRYLINMVKKAGKATNN